MQATTADSFQNREQTEPSGLRALFSQAADFIGTGIKKAGTLAFEFFMAHPGKTLLAADFLLTGGAVTQTALVAGTKTIAGAAGDLAVGGAKGLFHSLF